MALSKCDLASIKSSFFNATLPRTVSAYPHSKSIFNAYLAKRVASWRFNYKYVLAILAKI